ncbi:MAG: galactose-1-phosphate uridylyltransferase [Candidatus Doudnabacteria bacterium]|nr:galactose-1-phosphate uridylyltransferase [Candidatus Doudnabacteria bacterium]
MSEFRQNPITKSWVLIAPGRNKRPDEYKTYSVMHGVPEHDKTCVFCPGNESLNPEIERFDQEGNLLDLRSDQWEIRIIPNKFAALEHATAYSHKEFYFSHSGDGDHEVIITRKHNEPVALQSISIVESTLKVFIRRINELSRHGELAYVQLFHNHGRDAGASIVHPHYQLLATPIVPPHIHNEIMGCQHYYGIHGTDIYGDILKEELKVKDRILHESDHFVILSAYASRQPFETWIIPKRQSARFEDMTEDEIKHLSFVLKVTLGQLYTKLSDPPLNFYVHNMPLRKESKTYNEQAFRWHLTIFPRITTWAGFEYATGIPVNPIPPEVTAKFLRGD